jgi:hypothetical protein
MEIEVHIVFRGLTPWSLVPCVATCWRNICVLLPSTGCVRRNAGTALPNYTVSRIFWKILRLIFVHFHVPSFRSVLQKNLYCQSEVKEADKLHTKRRKAKEHSSNISAGWKVNTGLQTVCSGNSLPCAAHVREREALGNLRQGTWAVGFRRSELYELLAVWVPMRRENCIPPQIFETALRCFMVPALPHLPSSRWWCWMILTEETDILAEKPATVSLCSPQIPRGLV